MPFAPTLLAAIIALVSHASPDAAAGSPPDVTPHTDDWRLPPDQRAPLVALAPLLVDAINNADDAKRIDIIHRIFSAEILANPGPERIRAHLADVRSRFPNLDFHSATLAEMLINDRPSRVLHVFAKPQGDTLWRDFQVRVSASDPSRLDRIVFVAETTAPVFLPNTPIQSPDTLAWLDEHVDTLARDYDLSASALIAHGNNVIFERTLGHADLNASIPVTPDTQFSLGSGSKMFTAVLTLMLAREHKLALTDTLDKFFPDFPDKQAAAKITIAHLLSHTSGLAEYWTPDNEPSMRAARSMAGLLPLIYNAGLDAAPGAEFGYSNSNFVLAGLILERVSGKPYDDLVRERILTPLHLEHTAPFDPVNLPPTLAHRLSRDGDHWKASDNIGRSSAAGGWSSTPRDMLTFIRALHQGKLIPKDSLDQLLTPRTPADDYGLGMILQRNAGVDSYGHAGIARGVNAEVRYFPSLDITIVLFSNQDNGAYDTLKSTITKLVTGER